jgi:hypothetical protein
MLDNKQRFVIEDYEKKSPFSSFLPGISGRYGIPIWCHYVNRGQCITSFGVEDKDHAIMEFFPAHQAYQHTSQIGFRTFFKKNGKYIEAFLDSSKAKKMIIGMNELEIVEEDMENELITTVTYFTLPNEKVGGLVRKVNVQNMSSENIQLEILDGLPAVIPYGVNMGSMKEMGQTTKAWMQVEDVEQKVPYFRVRVSMEDTAAVSQVKGGNFCMGIDKEGYLMSPIVDPEVVFGYDTELKEAKEFLKSDINEVLAKAQVKQNNIPCIFYGMKQELKSNECITIYELIGQVEEKDILHSLLYQCTNTEYFDNKHKEAIALTEDICKVIHTKTGSAVFDAYAKQTYLDNVLRGGYPIVLGKDKIFYLYSRKHGDIERDYNYYRMLPEYYSQGNGNYRDVNQNRRCDVYFSPYVKDSNIKMFYNLIQIDGYNPLSVEKITYRIKEEEIDKVLSYARKENRSDLRDFFKESFTPGRLLMTAEKCSWNHDISLEEFLKLVITSSSSEINGAFGEGYWSDHWTYNLDLVENYLSIYPDKEEELLYLDESYTYFETRVVILDRKRRYVKTENGIRQYKSLDRISKKAVTNQVMRCDYGNGSIAKSNLMEKLILLTATKYATLDSYGMGVEMEGGKPGWYDALNGLPGLFGSSMAETYELCRLIEFTYRMAYKYQKDITVFKEVSELIEQLYLITVRYHNDLQREACVIDFWKEINDAKESYRKKTIWGVNGEKVILENTGLLAKLSMFKDTVTYGIKKAIAYGDGICPTYFYYEATKYDENESEDGTQINPIGFKVRFMPLFLEGPVRYLKLANPVDKKKRLYNMVKNSDLYDKKLSMYKVNASLKDASYEIGRTKAFTPGWLENESIWLHMEYKYLLELLKSELYKGFFEDLRKACIPFLDADTYGRSLLENSSFIASSVNPNEKIHGKGFVARLSGSTAEFIHMWQIMMFGKNPFYIQDNEMMLKLTPAIPFYLIDESKTIEAMFLGKVKVIYHLSRKEDVIPGEYTINEMDLLYEDGSNEKVKGAVLEERIAYKVREGSVKLISVNIIN